MRDLLKTILVAALGGVVGAGFLGAAVAADLLRIPQADGTSLYFGKNTIVDGEFLKRTGNGIASQAGGAGGGEVNTGSNVGAAGVGVYDSKSGVDLRFRKLNPASAKVTVALNSQQIDFDVATGTTSSTVCVGNDARLSDARTPSGSAGGDLTGTYPNPTFSTSVVTAFAKTFLDDAAAVNVRATLGLGSAALNNTPDFDIAGAAAAAQAASQPLDTDLTAIAALSSAADKLPYATGAGTWGLTDLSSFARTFIDDADAAAVRMTIGAGTGNGTVTSVSGTAPIASSGGATPAISLNDAGVTLAKMADLAQDKLIGRATASTGVPEAITCTAAGRAILDDADAAAQRTTLGLGSLATASTINDGNWSGTDLAVANGGTGAGDAGTARTNLGAAASGAVGSSGLTMNTARLLGRTTASSGAIEEMTVGAGLTLSAGALTANSKWAVLRKDSDQTGIGTSATDITGLTVAVSSGQRIRFKAYLMVRTSATGIGGMVSVNGPTASPVNFKRREWTSATVEAAPTMATALDAFTAQTAGPGATTVLYEMAGECTFSANGTFAARIKAESGGTCSVMEGSWVEYDIN